MKTELKNKIPDTLHLQKHIDKNKETNEIGTMCLVEVNKENQQG